jgi:hypothetical protein
MANDAVDELLAGIGKYWGDFHAKRAELLKTGAMRTTEIRNGKIVDTTDEELALSLKQASEMQKLIERHG